MPTLTTTIIVYDERGLHATPATHLSELAQRFESRITVRVISTNRTADAKSVTELMMTQAQFRDALEVTADGHDAAAAVCTLNASWCRWIVDAFPLLQVPRLLEITEERLVKRLGQLKQNPRYAAALTKVREAIVALRQ